jgi:hypothetical protein
MTVLASTWPSTDLAVCTTARSWMAEQRPMVTVLLSPRTTAPYHTLALPPTATRPTTLALGATKASFSTTGCLRAEGGDGRV